jgi:cystathionine gamma-synthase
MSESSTPEGLPLGLATNLLHADDEFHGPEVSPSISVTTSSSFYSYLDKSGKSGHRIRWTSAFRQTESPESTGRDLKCPELIRGSKTAVYSRYSQNVSTRVEYVLSKINVRTYTVLDKLSL